MNQEQSNINWPDGWFVYENGEVKGPFSTEETFTKKTQAEGCSQFMISRRGFGRWYPLRDLESVYKQGNHLGISDLLSVSEVESELAAAMRRLASLHTKTSLRSQAELRGILAFKREVGQSLELPAGESKTETNAETNAETEFKQSFDLGLTYRLEHQGRQQAESQPGSMPPAKKPIATKPPERTNLPGSRDGAVVRKNLSPRSSPLSIKARRSTPDEMVELGGSNPHSNSAAKLVLNSSPGEFSSREGEVEKRASENISNFDSPPEAKVNHRLDSVDGSDAREGYSESTPTLSAPVSDKPSEAKKNRRKSNLGGGLRGQSAGQSRLEKARSLAYNHMMLAGRLRLGEINSPIVESCAKFIAGFGFYWAFWLRKSAVAAVMHLDGTILAKSHRLVWLALIPGYHMVLVYKLAKTVLSLEQQNGYRTISPPRAALFSVFPPLAIYYVQSALNRHWILHVDSEVRRKHVQG